MGDFWQILLNNINNFKKSSKKISFCVLMVTSLVFKKETNMQVQPITEATNVRYVANNEKAEDKKEVKAQPSTVGYAAKEAAPTDANLYKAMYGVADKNEKTEKKMTKEEDDANYAEYRRAMGEYLEKWGTAEQIKQFNEPQQTKEEEDYSKQYEEYRRKYE